jgi:acetyl-CoA C-acetyltransferase
MAVIVGTGQVRRRPELDGPWDPQEPAQLMASAIEQALTDAASNASDEVTAVTLASEVTALACVDPIAWGYHDLCGSTISASGLTGISRTFTCPPGGNSPGDLLHDVANAIAAGEFEVAVIAGSEVLYSARRARKEGIDLQATWTPFAGRRDLLKGQRPLTTPTEARHGMVAPVQCYPMYENAIRAKAGRSIAEHQIVVANLMARNASVASTNPHAWFPQVQTAEDIVTVDARNRWVCFPYPKKMNAIMEVDQSAAVVIMSRDEADRRGIAREHQVAFLGGASCTDAWTPAERRDLAESPAIAAAGIAALAHAGLMMDDVDLIDLYSCFPSAVQMGMSALGLAHDDPRGVTVTGGLAYAGGPGNSYALHSLCVAVDRIRRGEAKVAMVTSLGMAASKHAVSIVGAHTSSERADSRAERVTLDRSVLEGSEVVDLVSGDGIVLTYTVEFGRDGFPVKTIYLVELDNGRRTVGNGMCTDEEIRVLMEEEGVGRRVSVLAGTIDTSPVDPATAAPAPPAGGPMVVGTPNIVTLI